MILQRVVFFHGGFLAWVIPPLGEGMWGEKTKKAFLPQGRNTIVIEYFVENVRVMGCVEL
jgi:hypothetical protein